MASFLEQPLDGGGEWWSGVHRVDVGGTLGGVAQRGLNDGRGSATGIQWLFGGIAAEQSIPRWQGWRPQGEEVPNGF
jgi:hypothetical protein